MKVSKHLRFSFVAVLSLFAIVVLSSCSKKDVKSDEPTFVSGTGASGTAGGEGGVGAGDAGQVSGDLKTVYFAYDSFRLSGEARATLKANAQWLKENPSSSVQVEGHCDERGTTEYNLALGERRANAAKDYLQRLGIDGGRLSVISYGEERPSDPGHDEAAWARNRRASFVTLSR